MRRAVLTALLLLALCAATGASPIPLADRVKHVVVVMLENRAFDNLFGYRPGVNGINGTEFNRVNASDDSSPKIFHTPTCPYINECDPNHGLPATTYKIFGPHAAATNNCTDPTMAGFVEYESAYAKHGAPFDYCNVMTGFTPDRLPIVNALADEFLLFDRFFAALPGPTWPNRLFFMAGTSSGLTETGPWYRDVVGQLFPTRTIFDQVAEAGGEWKVYFNDTPWELFVGTLAHNPAQLQPVDQLWADARDGTLPDFAFINPRTGINMSTGVGSNDQHPDHDVAAGESFLKDIYEALRASPQWNETLLVVTYDEHGGFFDHVPPPMGVPPPGDGETSFPDKGFLFDRLGVRIPTLLVSPWIAKGTVASAPLPHQKPAANSEFDLTSIIASTRKLLPLLAQTPPLTKRDAWAATFESFLGELDSPRTDCPMHLQAAPPPTRTPSDEAALPVNALQADIIAAHRSLTGAAAPTGTQGDVSAWLQGAYQQHHRRATAWRHSKQQPAYVAAIQPWGLAAVARDWNVSFSAAAAYQLLLCDIGKHDFYCLDAGAITRGGNVSVATCLAVDPPSNTDPAQQWVMHADATVRPFRNSRLCLTTAMYSGNPTPFLDACDALRVDQHFGYHGFGGGLYFGVLTNGLVVVNRTGL